MHYKTIQTPDKLIFKRYSYWQYVKKLLVVLIISASVLYFNIVYYTEINLIFIVSCIFFFYALAGLLKGNSFLKCFAEKIEFDKEKKLITIEHRKSAQKKLKLPYTSCLGFSISSITKEGSKRKSFKEHFLVVKFKNGSHWSLEEFSDENMAWQVLEKIEHYFIPDEKTYQVPENISIMSDDFKLNKTITSLTCTWYDSAPGRHNFTFIISLIFLIAVNGLIYFFVWDKTFPPFEEGFPIYIVVGLMNLTLFGLIIYSCFNFLKASMFQQSIKIENDYLHYKKKKTSVAEIADCRFDYYLTNETNFLFILNRQAYELKIDGNTLIKRDIIDDNLLFSIEYVKICPIDILCLSMAIKSMTVQKDSVL